MVLALPFPAMPLMSSYQCVPRWFALPPIAVPLMSAVHGSCFSAPCNSVDEFVSMCAALPCIAAHCSAVDEFLSMCAALPCFSVPCNSVDEMMSAVHGSFLYVPWEVLHMFCSLSFRFFCLL